ncbi:transposase [Microbulbifer sp. PSTR4-B]|uniref:transposase n=1 Tax=Microbulbifer sp. PSTR4-B TaxID=3243396 RepID=UPI0040396BA4
MERSSFTLSITEYMLEKTSILEEQGAWLQAWRRFLELLDQQSLLNWEEVFSDGRFVPAKKGASKPGKSSGARVQSGWWWSMAKVFHWEAPLLNVTYKNTKIHHLVYDKAADSDPLRNSLLSRGIDLICPYRRSRKKATRPDSRKLRRYTCRWKVERTFAWLGHYRRLVVMGI